MSRKTDVRSIELNLKRSSLDLLWNGLPWISQIGLILSGEGWSSHVFRDNPPQISHSTGKDASGAYLESSVLSHWQGRTDDSMEARKSPAFSAGLRLRFYEERQVLLGYLVYEGSESLAAEGAVKLVMPLLYGFEQGLSAWRNSPWWTNPQFVSSPRQIGSPSQQLLWKRNDGLFGLLLPLGGNGAKAWLGASGGEFGVELASFSSGFRATETPLFALAMGDDPYTLNESIFDLASLAMKGVFRPRVQKVFPEIFEGIGWCSWNTYYYDVDENKLMASARSMAAAKFPIRYMLIDDGWSTLRELEQQIHPDKPWPGTGRMLWDFKADDKKFPRGFKAAFDSLKQICGVKNIGVWHAFLGYWSYIHPGSPIAQDLAGSLIQAAHGGLVPDPREGRAKAFYDAWYRYLSAEGVSFLKVDDQSSTQFAYKKIIPLEQAARSLEWALQAAAEPYFGTAVINCMAMSWENVSALHQGNISRCSNDFLPTVPDNTPQHLVSNIYNSFWLSGASTPDFDMFQSHHAEGEHHALLRAISGGPVYFTDTPGLEEWEILWKLISSDGRLLRADVPARPTRDMLFSDPFEKPVALKAFTRVGEGGAVVAFNVFRGHERITADFSPGDVEGLTEGPYLVYEHFSGNVEILSGDSNLGFGLEVGGKKLFLVSPIEQGFAVVGLLDKFLSLKSIEKMERGKEKVSLLLRDPGRLGFYSKRPVAAVILEGEKVAFHQKPSGWCESLLSRASSGKCRVEIHFGAEK